MDVISAPSTAVRKVPHFHNLLAGDAVLTD